jgi:hypothetical protein
VHAIQVMNFRSRLRPGSCGAGASGESDETAWTRSHLLPFALGVYTTTPFVHDYWEEVYLIYLI